MKIDPSLLQSFCSKDTFREAICEPSAVHFPSGRTYAAATDGHMLIAIPLEWMSEPIIRTTDKPFPSIINLLDEAYLNAKQHILVPKSDLVKFAGTPTEEQPCTRCNGSGTIPCKQCKGEKKVEHDCDCDYCEYDEEITCPNCEGDGTNACPKCCLGHPAQIGCLFDEIYLNLRLLRQLLTIFPDGNIEISFNQPNDAILFRHEQTTIQALLMPFREIDKDDPNIVAHYPIPTLHT